MSAEWAGYFLLLSALWILGILIATTAFALAEPQAFVRWAWPLHWVSKKIFQEKSDKWNPVFAETSAVVTMTLLLAVSFLLGGWVITAALGLLNSPYSPFMIR